MIKNYLLITFRSLFKNQTYVLINLFGLGIAICCCIIAYLNYDFANSYDSQHMGRKGIYRVNFNRVFQGNETQYGIVPMPIANGVRANVPEDITLLRYYYSTKNVLVEDEWQQAGIAYADKGFLDVFNFPLAKGRKEDLASESDILITQKLARKFFGDEDPIGHQISHTTTTGTKDYQIVGVLETLPLNSSFRFDALTLFDALPIAFPDLDESSYRQYVIQFAWLPEGLGKEPLLALYDSYIGDQHKARDDFHINKFYLDPLEGMAKRAETLNVTSFWLSQGLPASAVIGPVIMAVFMMLLACFNFTNTSLALSNRRLKEIGIRKVLGGRRKELAAQFLGENLILCFMGLLLGLLLSEFLVPAYSSMWPFLEIDLDLTKDATFLTFLVSILVFTALFAGGYPALYVSGFDATRILKGTLKIKNNGFLAMSLLWLQFIIAIMSVTGGYLFYKNAVYQKEFDLGYDQNGIINIYFDEHQELTAFENQVKQNPYILATTRSEHQFYSGYYVDPIRYEDEIIEVSIMNVGDNYFNGMGMKILEGRDFIEDSDEDRKQHIVVNETMAKTLNWEDPVGKRIVWADSVELYVIGVVKDFVTDGLWNPIEPMMIRYNEKDSEKYLAIRANAANLFDLDDQLEAEWTAMFPDKLYTGGLLDRSFADAVTVNKNILIMFLFQAILGTLLAITGLYSLVSINIARRTKEIGIRKVLGASMLNIARVINSRYAYIYLFSAVTGSVMAYYLVGWLMGNIWEYHVTMKPGYFVSAVTLLFGVALVVVSHKIYKAASANPALSLRDE